MISEAIDLAREFSTESPRFINGVLDRLQRNANATRSIWRSDHGIVRQATEHFVQD